MSAPWYDTRDGIANALLGGLERFTELRRARHKAGYDDGESLAEWFVAGRYRLDTCGNTWTAGRPTAGGVLTAAQWREQERDDRDDLVTFSLSPVASHEHVCERCGQGWTVEDAWDFAGHESSMHRGCMRHHVADLVRAKMTGIVTSAGLDLNGLRSVPNGYGSEDYNGPWFVFPAARVGLVTIGWRKRVIQISWQRGPDGSTLFADWAGTVGPDYVHAWRPEDAATAIRRIADLPIDAGLASHRGEGP